MKYEADFALFVLCRCISLKLSVTVTAPWWSCQRAARQLSPDLAWEGPCRSASMRSSGRWAREILQWWNSLDTKSPKRRSAACLLLLQPQFNTLFFSSHFWIQLSSFCCGRWPSRSSTRPDWTLPTWRKFTERFRLWNCWTTPTSSNSTRCVLSSVSLQRSHWACQLGAFVQGGLCACSVCVYVCVCAGCCSQSMAHAACSLQKKVFFF